MATAARQYPLGSTSEQTQRLNKSVLFSIKISTEQAPWNSKCSQIRIASFRYPAKLRLSAAAVLRWCQSQPGCQLAPILKIMCITDTGDRRTGRCGANVTSIPSAADCDDLFCPCGTKFGHIQRCYLQCEQRAPANHQHIAEPEVVKILLLKNYVAQGISCCVGR